MTAFFFWKRFLIKVSKNIPDGAYVATQIEISRVKMAKPTIENSENHENRPNFKIGSRGRKTMRIGAKHF